VAGLAAAMGTEWSFSRGLMKVVGWSVLLVASWMLLNSVLRNAERSPSGPEPFRLPRERPPSPSAPAPSPSSGPLSLRSTPTNAA
jgi:hypothetical protein